MSIAKVRAHHGSLLQIAKTFQGEADAIRQTLKTLKQQQGVLQGGDWLGSSASKFYTEMDNNVLPAMARLAQALDSAKEITLKIHEIMKQTENDTARIFKSAGGGSSMGSVIGGVIGAAVGGVLGGPIGAAVGAAAGAEIGEAVSGGGGTGGSGGSSGAAAHPDTYDSPEEAAKVPEIMAKSEQLAAVGHDGPGAAQLVDDLARLTTHGSGDRAVIGKGGDVPEWIEDAKTNGGVWFETPKGFYETVGKDLAWDVNQRFLQQQLESGIPKIDYVGEPVEQVLTDPAIRGKTRWREVQYLMANAGQYGYELQGNSWVKVR